MPTTTKFLDWPSLQEFKNKLDETFATQDSLDDYQPLIDADNKLSKDLVSGLGTAASADSTDFATAAQGLKADEAIPDPTTKSDGQLLMYSGSQQKWVASNAPASGVISVTAGDDTITIGGTSANPTVKVTGNKFDAAGAASAVQGNTASTVKDAMDAAAAAQTTADSKQDPLQFTGTYDASTNKVVLADYVADAVALAANGGFEVVQILPEPTEANYKKRIIYLYQPVGATSYEEYIIARSGSGTEQDPYTYTREKLGDTDIQLTNYWAKAELVAITTAEVDSLFN